MAVATLVNHSTINKYKLKTQRQPVTMKGRAAGKKNTVASTVALDGREEECSKNLNMKRVRLF